MKDKTTWTVDEIVQMVVWNEGSLLPTLLPSYGIKYVQRRGGAQYFQGMTARQIAADFYRYFGKPEELIPKLTEEATKRHKKHNQHEE
jgi:hypothetical protein